MRTPEEFNAALANCEGVGEQLLVVLDEVATTIAEWASFICPDWEMGFAIDFVNNGLSEMLETTYCFSRGNELVKVPVQVSFANLTKLAMPQIIFNDLSAIKNSAIYNKAGFDTFAFKEIYLQMWKLAGKAAEYQLKEVKRDV